MTTEVDSSAQKQGPWGEAWKEDNNTDDPYLPDYKFTGKEQDATKLYYYGARYYDPQSNVWLSADPVLGKFIPNKRFESNMKLSRVSEKYEDLPGEGGVFNPVNMALYNYVDSVGKGDGKMGVFNSKNLNLFAYCRQNPIGAVDPDGLWTIAVTGFQSAEAITDVGVEHGIIFGWSKEHGWEFGITKTYSVGMETDIGGFVGMKIEWTGAQGIEKTTGSGIEYFTEIGGKGLTGGGALGIAGEPDDVYGVISGHFGAGLGKVPASVGISFPFTKTEKVTEQDVINYLQWNVINNE